MMPEEGERSLKKYALYWLWGAFALVGALMLVASAFVYAPYLERGWDWGWGQVTSAQNGSITIQYEVEGETYHAEFHGRASSLEPGSEAQLRYRTQDPQTVRCCTLDLAFVVFPILGVLFGGMGLTGLLILTKGRSRAKKLRETGRRVMAKFEETAMCFNVNVNGRHPYYIIVSWQDPASKKTYLFKSGLLWINPDILIAQRDLRQFPVYLDPKNPKHYTVDTDAITRDVMDLT